MKNEIRHSAEGSTWTKKNHKYIRKEGNRYIYPEDVKNGRRVGGGPIRRTKNKTARDILSEKGIRNVRYEDLPAYNRASNSLEGSTYRYRNTITKDKDGNYRETTNYKNDYDDSISTIKMPYDVNYMYRDEIKANKRKERQAENRSNAMNNQGSADYKQLSQQRLNRKAAANGQVVNPIATWRGSDGRVIAREKTNDKISTPTASDYKKYGQLRGGASNRSKAMSNQGSTDYKQISRNHADHQKELRELREMEMEERREKSRKSGNQAVQNAKNAKNRAEESKSRVSKEYARDLRGNTGSKSEYWDKIKNRTGMHPKTKSNASNKSDYEQELEANSRKNDGSIDTKPITTKPIETKPIEVKKSTNGQKGHFTLGEDGQTKFVPESENKPKKKTNKALEKGKEAISKIKNAFRKKTDREKGVISTREYRDYGKVNPGTLKEQMIRDGSGNREHYDYTTNRQALYNNEESRKKAEKKYRKGKTRYEPVSEYDKFHYSPDTDSKRFRERYEEKKRRR